MDVDALLQGGGLILSGVALRTIVDAVSKMWSARHQRTEIATQPLEVRGAPEYVTREEFDKHASDNARDHENLFARLNRNDRETSVMNGTLNAIREDVTLIKNKLLKTRT